MPSRTATSAAISAFFRHGLSSNYSREQTRQDWENNPDRPHNRRRAQTEAQHTQTRRRRYIERHPRPHNPAFPCPTCGRAGEHTDRINLPQETTQAPVPVPPGDERPFPYGRAPPRAAPGAPAEGDAESIDEWDTTSNHTAAEDPEGNMAAARDIRETRGGRVTPPPRSETTTRSTTSQRTRTIPRTMRSGRTDGSATMSGAPSASSSNYSKPVEGSSEANTARNTARNTGNVREPAGPSAGRVTPPPRIETTTRSATLQQTRTLPRTMRSGRGRSATVSVASPATTNTYFSDDDGLTIGSGPSAGAWKREREKEREKASGRKQNFAKRVFGHVKRHL